VPLYKDSDSAAVDPAVSQVEAQREVDPPLLRPTALFPPLHRPLSVEPAGPVQRDSDASQDGLPLDLLLQLMLWRLRHRRLQD